MLRKALSSFYLCSSTSNLVLTVKKRASTCTQQQSKKQLKYHW